MSSWLKVDPVEFADKYNRQPFKVGHQLVDHPSFRTEELRRLVLSIPRPDVLWRHAVVPIDTDFDHAHREHANQLSLEDTFDRLAEIDGYIVINYPERDPVFRALTDEVLAEIKALIEPHDPGFYWYATYLFISSGGSVTPYHMDREMNFLLQIRGTKQVSLWSPSDRAVMSELERERLFTDYSAKRPQWRDDLKALEQHFEIRPGDGVHHPFIAPHAVVNGKAPSVSWAITFRTRGSDRKGYVHRVNHRLRRFGLTPTPEGQSRTRDWLKSSAFGLVKRAFRTVRPATGDTSPWELPPKG